MLIVGGLLLIVYSVLFMIILVHGIRKNRNDATARRRQALEFPDRIKNGNRSRP
jgi:hypothetical protein